MDGEAVVFNDHILLYNQKYNCYLHISEEFKNDQVKESQIKQDLKNITDLVKTNKAAAREKYSHAYETIT